MTPHPVAGWRTPSRNNGPQWLAAVASVASALYLATLLVAPILGESDVLRSHPEDYAAGASGVFVRVGYAALAVMALAIAYRAWATDVAVGRAAALSLLAGGATAAALAVVPQEVSAGPLLLGVFALAAAPLLLSITERRRLPRSLVVLGGCVTAAFAALAIAPPEVAGLVNRLWDASLALWGLLVAVIPVSAPARTDTA